MNRKAKNVFVNLKYKQNVAKITKNYTANNFQNVPTNKYYVNM